METAFQNQAFSILAILAVLLMVIVTGGVVYLTAAEWRDRRRRKLDQEATAPKIKKTRKKKSK
ncbi:MAG: hypothetical protein AAF722_13945 [Cyanobacteria bacterium P01_C01_bin.70]